jgi:integrase
VNFRTNHRGRIVQVGDFRKVWKGRCDKLGLSGLRFHDLRRTFITTADRAGVPRTDAMGMSGHKTQSVYARYCISNPDSKRAAIEKMKAYRATQNGANSGLNANQDAPKPDARVGLVN